MLMHGFVTSDIPTVYKQQHTEVLNLCLKNQPHCLKPAVYNIYHICQYYCVKSHDKSVIILW